MKSDDEVILNVEKEIWNSISKDDRIGLFTGLSGKALFYYYLYLEYKNDNYKYKLFSIIEKINIIIETYDILPSFSSGLAGYGWLLMNLKEIDIEIEDSYYNQLDEMMASSLLNFCKEDNYDLLHGSLGIFMYFISRNKHSIRKKYRTLQKKYFEELVFKINSDLDYVLINSDGIGKVFYFGLAHGAASLLNFLIYYCLNFNAFNLKTERAILKIITFLNDNRLKEKDKQSHMYFPNLKDERGVYTTARLSWCQGDLGIGLSIYNAGMLLNNEDLAKDGLSLVNSTQNILVNDSGIDDYIICHGTCGILLQYMILQNKININEYQNTINYWKSNLILQTDNYSKFNTFYKDSWVEESSLLDGITGLGLTLLSLKSKSNQGWLSALLLF